MEKLISRRALRNAKSGDKSERMCVDFRYLDNKTHSETKEELKNAKSAAANLNRHSTIVDNSNSETAQDAPMIQPDSRQTYMIAQLSPDKSTPTKQELSDTERPTETLQSPEFFKKIHKTIEEKKNEHSEK